MRSKRKASMKPLKDSNYYNDMDTSKVFHYYYLNNIHNQEPLKEIESYLNNLEPSKEVECYMRRLSHDNKMSREGFPDMPPLVNQEKSTSTCSLSDTEKVTINDPLLISPWNEKRLNTSAAGSHTNWEKDMSSSYTTYDDRLLISPRNKKRRNTSYTVHDDPLLTSCYNDKRIDTSAMEHKDELNDATLKRPNTSESNAPGQKHKRKSKSQNPFDNEYMHQSKKIYPDMEQQSTTRLISEAPTNHEHDTNPPDNKGKGLCVDMEQQSTSKLISEAPINHAHDANPPDNKAPNLYIDLGDCNYTCEYCKARFWYEERLKTASQRNRLKYSRCCAGGQMYLEKELEPPPYIKEIFKDKHFLANIRAYNQMFSMTSFGAQIDDSINNGKGPYVFKISGQIYHWIGTVCPTNKDDPKFMQLYIYDTENEVTNRMKAFGGSNHSGLDTDIVQNLIKILDEHNELVKVFRQARDKVNEANVPEFKIQLYNVVGSREHQLPTSNTLGAIVFEPDGNSRSDYDIIIEYKDKQPKRINKLHSSYMGLQFPLLFVYGQPGYNTNMTLQGVSANRKRTKMSMNMYYKYQLHERSDEYGILFKAGRLFQQYIVTVYCTLEQTRLDFIRAKQNNLRSECLAGICDAISKGDHSGADIGQKIILPSTFTGGPRYMYSHYLDALAICRVLGNPQYFITFTCNVNWPEIKRHMKNFPGLTQSDRADVVTRVFEQKVEDFIKILKEQHIFGQSTGVLYTIEFQKRGLPHCHTLLWLNANNKIKNPEHVDSFISAELPDMATDPAGYRVVADMMIHGPCGIANPKAPCMQEGVCTKKYPKKYNDSTYFDENGHIHYRRRKTDAYVPKGELKLDNTHVVPYNRQLCLMFDAHINVEYCGWSMLIKYLFKYISKGTDRIAAKIVKPLGDQTPSSSFPQIQIDEIQNFIDGRFLCPHESCWRILDFPIHHREPAVQILAVHLKDMQKITFHDKEPLGHIVTDDGRKLTTLTEWFTYNALFEDGRHLTYLDFPSEYVWYEDRKIWKRRVIKTKHSIGRLVYVHPAAGELFYFRMLLAHQKGCRSFIEVRTVNNKVFETYRAACEAMGLLHDDSEWNVALEEASMSASSQELRALFANILMHCEVANPVQLWEKHWHSMKDDIPAKASQKSGVRNLHINDPEIKNFILYEIEIILNDSSKSIKEYGFSLPSCDLLEALENRLLMEEKNYNRQQLKEEVDHSVATLNNEQLAIYNTIITACNDKKQELVFVYGHGGTGKTFLWNTIIKSLRSEGRIVLAVASSGIASLLLPSGRTAHSRFKIPLELTDESMCQIKKNTIMSELLIQTDLIVWDEAPMNNRHCFEALDRTLKDILNTSQKAFGGKSVMLGGDFRQTLPVKKKGTKSQIIGLSIATSYLWKHFKVFKLKENMRLAQRNLSEDQRTMIQDFSSWLLNIGDGKLGEPDQENSDDVAWVTIPPQYLILDGETAIQELINFIYDENTLKNPTAHLLQQKAIVCPKNETTDTINEKILTHIQGEPTIYISSDEAIPVGREGAATEMLYPPEYLNTFKFPGLPPNILQLKTGVPIMMLRNMNLGGGLCNGTRLIVKNLTSKLIEAEIITGTRIGEKVYIPRIPLQHKDPNYPFIFKRKQFPVKVCYAMTINKSQGQSLTKIGVYLPQPVFTHGQLYVALSRATSPNGLKILLTPNPDRASNETKNIVYKDFLNKICTQEDNANYHQGLETSSRQSPVDFIKYFEPASVENSDFLDPVLQITEKPSDSTTTQQTFNQPQPQETIPSLEYNISTSGASLEGTQEPTTEHEPSPSTTLVTTKHSRTEPATNTPPQEQQNPDTVATPPPNTQTETTSTHIKQTSTGDTSSRHTATKRPLFQEGTSDNKKAKK